MLEALVLVAAEPAFDLRDTLAPVATTPAVEEPLPVAVKPRAWTPAIKRREIAFQMLNLIDGAQTVYCIHITEQCHEANPVWGRHPSVEKIVGIKLASGVVHYFTTDYLAKHDPKAAAFFQWASIGLQGGVVAWNTKVMF